MRNEPEQQILNRPKKTVAIRAEAIPKGPESLNVLQFILIIQHQWRIKGLRPQQANSAQEEQHEKRSVSLLHQRDP